MLGKNFILCWVLFLLLNVINHCTNINMLTFPHDKVPGKSVSYNMEYSYTKRVESGDFRMPCSNILQCCWLVEEETSGGQSTYYWQNTCFWLVWKMWACSITFLSLSLFQEFCLALFLLAVKSAFLHNSAGLLGDCVLQFAFGVHSLTGILVNYFD